MRKRETDCDFLSPYDTKVVNGFFVALVFLSHCSQYITASGDSLHPYYVHVQNIHNQWVVTTFLAFSGYGVMLNLLTKGSRYLQTYPQKRLLKTLLNFDVAVAIYLVIAFLLGVSYNRFQILGALVGLTSVGNSNWYIFSILIMYLATYISAIVWRDNYTAVIITVFLISLLFVIVAHGVQLPSRFVSTIFSYSCGMIVAFKKREILALFKEKRIGSFLLIAFGIVITYRYRMNDYIMNISSVLFVLFVIWMMAAFSFESSIFFFLGNHVFSIYVLQRIPMIVLSDIIGENAINPIVFVILCFVLTVGISVIFDRLIYRIDKIIVKV